MADEATIRSSLQISNGNLLYRSYPTDFTADVTGSKGPSPGAIAVATAGTDIDLSELTTPALCKITNLDTTNYVELGVWDGSAFYPLMEILAGEFYVFRLSRNLGNEYGVGTATSDSGNTLRLKANGASVNVIVEAFEA